MKLIRYGQPDLEKPGVELENGERIDVSNFGEDFNEQFFATDGIKRLKEWLNEHKNTCAPISVSERLGAPLCRPSKIICVGLNYANHAKESGMEIPSEPVLFFKATTAICGPNDDVLLPKESTKMDWEVELGVVIGKKTSYVTEDEAMNYVAGYILHNDISEREFQLEKLGQWVKGKSHDTFAPLGPYLVPKTNIKDPHQLNLWLKVNDKMVQNSNTNDLVFDIPQLVAYISRFMTLLPGDIISTGTPEGVGLGMDPPVYLQEGDIMELGIEGLGSAIQKVVKMPSEC